MGLACVTVRSDKTAMVDMSALRSRAKNATEDSGEASLNKLGYKQELKRGFSFMNNAAMSFRCTTSTYIHRP